MNGKKTVLLGAIRVSEKFAAEYKLALEYYGLTRPEFARMCIGQLIKHRREGSDLEIPVRFCSRECGREAHGWTTKNRQESHSI
jgi:hypothetical protein